MNLLNLLSTSYWKLDAKSATVSSNKPPIIDRLKKKKPTHLNFSFPFLKYCSTSRAIEVSQFLLEYDDNKKGNRNPSVSFDISAQSVETGLKANLELSLVAYGISAVNTTINLCSDSLGGAVCPIPRYDFEGAASEF